MQRSDGMSDELAFIESVLLTCLEKRPVDFSRVDDAEAERARQAIKKADSPKGRGFRSPMRRNDFLCGCGDFTNGFADEHLIVGYGFRYRGTTAIERVHHVVGEQRRVAIPAYVRDEIRRHHFHRDDAEVVVYHNHPRTGSEPEWFYAFKALIDDCPIPSNADRMQLLRHSFNIVGVARRIFGGGQVLFFLGESGLVKEFHFPSLLALLKRDQANISRGS